MPIKQVKIEGKKLKKISKKKKIILISSAVAFLLLLILGAVGFYSSKKIDSVTNNLKVVNAEMKEVQAAVEEQDVIKAKEQLLELHTGLESTKEDLNSVRFLGAVPIVKWYYKDAVHALNAAVLGVQAGEMVADSVIPFGDILGLKGVESDQKADKKIETLVTKVFPSLSEKVGELEKIFNDIKLEVDQIDPERYPEDLEIGGLHVRQSIIQAKEGMAGLEPFIPQAKHALEVLPSVLGYKKEKTYLIWFQNDKELRATGGFITAYGTARIKNGKLLDVTSDDIYQLDKQFTPTEDPPDPLRKYLFLKIFPIRDANMSPDFVTSVEKFESFYKTIPNQPEVDGVVTINTEVVRRFLELTGPITVEKFNETFSAENHPEYNIPDVVYKLELYAEKILAGNDDRKGLIGDLMDKMLDKLFSAKPEEFPKIFETFLKAAEEKHMLFYFHNDKAQSLVEELNFGGRIKDFDGDYLHINNANFGGLKGNLYMKASAEQDIKISPNGTVTKKVTITIRNTESADGWLNSVYQNWMRLYVPKGSKLLGSEVFADFVETEDLNKRVWESFSRTLPLGESVTSFTYELPFKVQKGQTYRLLMQKQPSIDMHMVVKINGKIIEDLELVKDKQIELEI